MHNTSYKVILIFFGGRGGEGGLLFLVFVCGFLLEYIVAYNIGCVIEVTEELLKIFFKY
jgi:hypothetical protein